MATKQTVTTLYDALGNGFSVGDTLIATGLQSAGRSHEVLIIGRSGRVQLRENLSGRVFWTFARHYRVHVA